VLGLSYAIRLSPRIEKRVATLFTPSPSRVGHPGDPYRGPFPSSLIARHCWWRFRLGFFLEVLMKQARKERKWWPMSLVILPYWGPLFIDPGGNWISWREAEHSGFGLMKNKVKGEKTEVEAPRRQCVDEREATQGKSKIYLPSTQSTRRCWCWMLLHAWRWGGASWFEKNFGMKVFLFQNWGHVLIPFFGVCPIDAE